jgi:aquaporin SIP
MGAIKAAIGDAVLTFMWVFSASTLGAATTVTARALGIEGLVWPSVFITTVLVFVLVFFFTLIADALGGASFNPTGTASFYAAGLGPDTLFSMALRFPAQVFSFSFSISQFHLTNNMACMPRLCLFIFLFLI